MKEEEKLPRLTMGDWHKVSTRKQHKTGEGKHTAAKRTASTALSEVQVKNFLSTFKTMECNVKEHHDPRICNAYHDPARDRRRNPYVDYYEPDDCLNQFEQMYHPAIFRTAVCYHGDQQCIFGRLCSHAHSSKDLRERSAAIHSFASRSTVDSRPLPQMTSFLPEKESKRAFYSECQSLWKELHLVTVSRFLALNPEQWFLVNRSEALFSDIEEAAFLEGMGCVIRHWNAGQHGLLLKGLHLECTQLLIDDLLSLPSPHFALEDRHYGERVVSSLSEMLQSREGRRSITTSENVLIQTREDTNIRIVAVSSKTESSAEVHVRDVLDKIDFWVKQEGYGNFVECRCCFDRRNPDQGIACLNGHFYCSVEQCFETAISAQIIHLRSRDEGLICPECNAQYKMQEIGRHLPSSIWDEVQEALINKKVERQYEALAKDFDARLEAKVQDLISKYGSASEQLKSKAQSHAL